MADHSDLVAEMPFVERLQLSERLRHAKKRRAQQLKAYLQREKRLTKEANAGKRNGGKRGSGDTSAVHIDLSAANQSSAQKRLQFADSILMLEAVAQNDINEVTRLLESGISPNVSGSDGLTPLHQCCITNAEAMLRVLLSAGADVNARDTENWTPLHAAAACGRVSLCQCLCESGADLLAINSDGNMPYDLCEDVSALDYIETQMTKRGVTQELIDETRLTAENCMLSDTKNLLTDGGNIEWRGCSGESLLHVAACCGYTRVMQLLIDCGIRLNTPDSDGWEPIHCAAYWSQVAAVELLLQYGVNATSKTEDGLTVLDLCEDLEARQRIMEVIEELANKKPKKRVDTLKEGPGMHRRASSSRRSSNAGLQAMYAWQRRSSLRDKKDAFAWREAQEEGQRYREAVLTTAREDEDDQLAADNSTLSPVVDNEKTGLLTCASPNNSQKDTDSQSDVMLAANTTKPDVIPLDSSNIIVVDDGETIVPVSPIEKKTYQKSGSISSDTENKRISLFTKKLRSNHDVCNKETRQVVKSRKSKNCCTLL